ncbi:oligosaccharide flippase family protein [Vibrio splendidus]|uniref:oligosaccharide flippase family protein n=1 Tax=Vibrio splendidus TaxID=29497 RepID=UPI002468910F|nr:oligosaccharide flippase family protein [Vibrio splendidus]MDH5979484.1 oligosaccharide flippase family protein [Vibrio splendidus]
MSLIPKSRWSIKNNEILLGTISAFVVKIVSAAGMFFLNVLVARYLGVEQAGIFFLSQAICIVLANITRQGYDNALIRFIAGYRIEGDTKTISELVQYVGIRVLIASLFTAALVFLLSPFLSEHIFEKKELDQTLKIAAWLIVPLSLSQLIGFCFQGLKKVVFGMLYQSCLLVIISVFSIIIFSPEDAESLMRIYVVCSLSVASLAVYQWNKAIPVRISTLHEDDKKSINKVIGPLFFILLLNQTTQWAGQLMLGAWSSTADVALFAAAQRTAMLISFVLIAVNAIAAPRFAEAFKQNRPNEIKQVALSSSRLMTAAAIPILIFIIVFAPWLMGLFGSDFVDGSNILRILVIGQFVNVITGSVGYLLQMTANEKTLRNNMLISSFIFVVGSVIAIPLYGVLGAAVVTAVAIATQNLLCVYQVKKTLGFNTLSIFSR